MMRGVSSCAPLRPVPLASPLFLSHGGPRKRYCLLGTLAADRSAAMEQHSGNFSRIAACSCSDSAAKPALGCCYMHPQKRGPASNGQKRITGCAGPEQSWNRDSAAGRFAGGRCRFSAVAAATMRILPGHCCRPSDSWETSPKRGGDVRNVASAAARRRWTSVSHLSLSGSSPVPHLLLRRPGAASPPKPPTPTQQITPTFFFSPAPHPYCFMGYHSSPLMVSPAPPRRQRSVNPSVAAPAICSPPFTVPLSPPRRQGFVPHPTLFTVVPLARQWRDHLYGFVCGSGGGRPPHPCAAEQQEGLAEKIKK